jgi:hypothetical protein
MKRYIILLFTVFSIANAQVDTSLIERGRILVAYHDSSSWSFLVRIRKDSTMIDKILQWYKFNYEIKSPLTKVKFLLYQNSNRAPSANHLIVAYKDTFLVSQFYDEENGYGCDSLIDFINQRLADEQPLTVDHIDDMAECITKLSDPGFDSYKIVSSWKEIKWAPESNGVNDHYANMPDSLKAIIKPITVSSQNGIIEADYFVWNEEYTSLRKIKLIYTDSQIKVQNQKLGLYGVGFIRL